MSRALKDRYGLDVLEQQRLAGVDQNPKGFRDLLESGYRQVERGLREKDTKIYQLLRTIDEMRSKASWEASARHAERSGGTQ